MKRILFSLIGVIFALTSCDANDQMIKLNEIPAKAQAFISEHFPTHQVQYIIKDKNIIGDEYEVKFTNGDEIDFDKNGEWEMIDCEFSEVPSKVIPEKILTYITTNFKDMKITSIEKKSNLYEIELNNNLEILFNKDYDFIKIDN